MKVVRFVPAAVAAACVAGLAAQGGLPRYGVTEVAARQITMSAVVGMYGVGAVSKTFLALPPAGRAAAVTEAASWGKAYLSSPGFAQTWIAERDRAKPEPPVIKGTVDEETQQESAAQLQQCADMRKEAEKSPPAERIKLESLIKEMEDKAKDTAAVRRSIVNRRAEDQERFLADTKKWEEERPVDPKPVIRKRLQTFLDVTADVDFAAKTDTREGQRVFVDERYEQKSNIWKMCFRAGREATAAARAAAAAWLKELGPA